jgi:hypothetical protein
MLWALGSLGFIARGGLVILVLPIVTIPSPVLLSIFFRDEISTSGPAPGFLLASVLVALVCGIVVLLGLLASAWTDVEAFDRTVTDPEMDTLRMGRVAVTQAGSERSSTWLWVAAIEAAGLVPILLAALLTARRIGTVLVEELQVPSSVDVPLATRVAVGAVPEILATIVVAILAEIATSLASRRLMAWRWGLASPGSPPGGEVRQAVTGALRLVRRPLRTLGNAVIAWLVTLATVVTVLGATIVAWSGARDVLVASGSGPGGLLGPALAVVIFATIWVGGLVLVGLGSAIRGAIWTVDALR